MFTKLPSANYISRWKNWRVFYLSAAAISSPPCLLRFIFPASLPETLAPKVETIGFRNGEGCRFRMRGETKARGQSSGGGETVFSSEFSEEDLKILVEKSLLQPKELVHWRSSIGESSPSPKDSEILLFASFLKHGLALPACDFLRGLLYYYGIQIHHLTPESILHLSIFVHLCEEFLGIKPHFELFRRLLVGSPAF